MKITSKDICWLAGLVEGEGSFVFNHKSLVMTINSTDWDVINHAGMLMDAPVRGPYAQCGHGTKPMYRVSTYGAEWPMTLYSLLGERRRNKIKELLTPWRSSGSRKRKNKVHYNQ